MLEPNFVTLAKAADTIALSLRLDIQDARTQLVVILADELLTAEGMLDTRPKYDPVPSSWWAAWEEDRGPFHINIPHNLFESPRVKTRINFDASTARRIVDGQAIFYQLVRVPFKALKEQLAPASAPQRNKGGNPGKFDWNDFWIEIVRITYCESIEDRLKLHRHMMEYVTAWPEAPEESEIRKRLRLLYKRGCQEGWLSDRN